MSLYPEVIPAAELQVKLQDTLALITSISQSMTNISPFLYQELKEGTPPLLQRKRCATFTNQVSTSTSPRPNGESLIHAATMSRSQAHAATMSRSQAHAATMSRSQAHAATMSRNQVRTATMTRSQVNRATGNTQQSK